MMLSYQISNSSQIFVRLEVFSNYFLIQSSCSHMFYSPISDRQRAYSVFKNDSFVVVRRQGRLVDSFGAHVVFSTSDGVHSSVLRLSREQTFFVILVRDVVSDYVFLHSFTFLFRFSVSHFDGV